MLLVRDVMTACRRIGELHRELRETLRRPIK